LQLNFIYIAIKQAIRINRKAEHTDFLIQIFSVQQYVSSHALFLFKKEEIIAENKFFQKLKFFSRKKCIFEVKVFFIERFILKTSIN